MFIKDFEGEISFIPSSTGLISIHTAAISIGINLLV
jgi:hypothetical protein